jgi:hypothetical protein
MLRSILSIVPEIILSILRRLRHFFNNVLKYAERSEALRHPLVNIILYERIRMKLNLPDVTNSNSVSVINSNFAAIEQELQNKVLYRDNPSGEPNTLETALDANGKEIYNAGTLRTTNLYIDGERVIPSGVVVVEGETDISGLLVKTANLSDVQSAATSRINLGLGNVDNTSDLNKPISTNTASALAGKQATLVSGVNIKTINSNSIVGSGDLVLTGVGETNTTSNLGSGQGLAAPKSGVNLPFKSLVSGTNVTMSSTADAVTINATVDTSTLLVKANNLSDVQSTTTSRTNLGLGNVDNTSDANKPISIATASSLATKQSTLVSGSNIKTINGTSILGSGNLNVTSPWLNVIDYGADKTGAADSATAFQNTINALPATGGRIVVPDGNYLINTNPNIGTKSVYWDIGVGSVFTGSGIGPGKFPYVSSVGAQMSVGPLIRSQTSVHAVDPGGGYNAGVAALQIEMLQPDSYGAGNSLGAYIGATSNNANVNGNSWALNTLIKVGPAATGTHQCIEIDVDLESAAALTKGVSISGIGTVNPDVGIEIIRGPAIGGTPYIQTYWERGIDIMTSVIGLQIRDTCSSGIAINNPGQTADTPISAKQRIVNGDTLVLQRTNDGSTGNYIRGVNSANTVNMFTIDGDGDSYFQNGVYAGYLAAYGGMGTANLTITSPAGSVAAGYICIGNQVFGSAGGLVGYIEIFRGSTPYKIPYYTW